MSRSPMQYMPVETRNLKRSPNCIFYVNGDGFSKGSKFCISNRIKTLDGVKDELTQVLYKDKNQIGYVRNIYTPVGGTRLRSIQEFKDGQDYVAALNDKFQPIKISYYGQYQMPVHHATIPFNNCGDLEKIMIQIERERQVPQIKQMFKVLNYGGSPDNFIEINDCQELSQEEHVLLTFKREDKNKFHEYYLPQGKRNFTVAVSPRHGPAYNFPSFPDQSTPKGKSGSLNKHRVLPSIGSSSKHSEPASPFSNPPNSQGSSGVYRAKKQNNARGAQQVNETRETRTEKPIDQMEAETVDEEEIHTKEKTTPIPPGTELNKQPSKDLKHSAGNKKGKAKGSKDFENSENGNQTRDETETKNVDGDKLEREETPDDLKFKNVMDESQVEENMNESNVETNRPPMSTSPPHVPLVAEQDQSYEEAAAVKIQAGARGYMERKKFNARKEEMKREKESRARDNQTKDDQKAGAGEQKSGGGQKEGMNEDEAATKIQASFKGYKTRKEMNVKKQQVRDSDELGRQEKVAATKIQSNYRGYKVRKDYNKRKNMRNAETKQETDINANEKKDDDKDTADAAVKIQSSYRGYRTRKELKGKKTNQAETEKDSSKKYSDDEAAIKIQAGYRGYKTRKDYSKKKALNKTDNSKEEDAAATKIQANYKGYKERQKYHKEKEQEVEDEAASNVQAAFRGYKTRQEISKDSQLPDQAPTPRPDSAEINKAATKIQSNYRGYRTRKEFKDKKFTFCLLY
ncbi:ASPM-like protein [Mya arenaria]|uniref:ASPM-like protein n=1 Tax=Mya arenaria TaxID=6604 RepID=A0ABY7F1R9_MYAAR|nr:ASPM-like protein [Mya arenaria]